MNSKSILFSVAISLAAFSLSSFAAGTPDKSELIPAKKAKLYASNPKSLKDFLAHPTYCNIYTGVNYDNDVMSYEASKDYSQAVVDLLPNEADTSGVREILSNVRSACLSKLSAASN